MLHETTRIAELLLIFQNISIDLLATGPADTEPINLGCPGIIEQTPISRQLSAQNR